MSKKQNKKTTVYEYTKYAYIPFNSSGKISSLTKNKLENKFFSAKYNFISTLSLHSIIRLL